MIFQRQTSSKLGHLEHLIPQFILLFHFFYVFICSVCFSSFRVLIHLLYEVSHSCVLGVFFSTVIPHFSFGPFLYDTLLKKKRKKRKERFLNAGFEISKWWRANTSNSPCFLEQMLKALSSFFFCFSTSYQT